MITIFLRETRGRLLLVALIAIVLYRLDPSYHLHFHEEAISAERGDPSLSPAGTAATLSYLAGLSTIVLLAGFVADDRRRGYTQLFFSHPVRPLAFYLLRWLVRVAVAFVVVVVFYVGAQLLAWGELRAGPAGLGLAALTIIAYGGLMWFLSAAARGGEGWIAALLFVPTFVPQILGRLREAVGPGGYRLAQLVLPPQNAFQDVYYWILTGAPAWGAVAYAIGYGLVWGAVGAALLASREWG